MSANEQAVGIDVANDSAWLVALQGFPRPSVIKVELCHPVDLGVVVQFCAEAKAVAIDAPGGYSALAHLGDDRVGGKFRRGRCSEVALARRGIAVPWVTPPETDLAIAGWMTTGFALWRALEAVGMLPLETYPHGVLWRLAGRQLTHKQRPVGALARLRVLGEVIELPLGCQMWSHDGLDALAAAFVAWQSLNGLAERIDCAADEAWPEHDGSGIWLPKIASVD